MHTDQEAFDLASVLIVAVKTYQLAYLSRHYRSRCSRLQLWFFSKYCDESDYNACRKLGLY